MWLRAMYRFYCKKNNCTTVFYPSGLCEAIGNNAHKADYAYEIAYAHLTVRIINQVAKNGKSVKTIVAETSKEFVKELYGRHV